MSAADHVWNRACFASERSMWPGDQALADLLRLHGEAMNNGLLHAVVVMDPDAIAAAARAYRYFGLGAAATVVEDVAGRLIEALDLESGERLEHEADRRYGTVVHTDSVLVDAFKRKFEQRPSDFAPLDE